MFLFRNLFTLLLSGSLSACAVASDDPAVALAALDVISTNARGVGICEGAQPNVDRPDRIKLARVVDALPDPNAKYSLGLDDITPLEMAVLADNTESLERLWERGARWNNHASASVAMYEAAQHGSPALLASLMRQGLGPDTSKKDGWSPLMAAAYANRPDNVAALLKAGANVNNVMPNGLSALHGAVVCRNQVMVNVLLRAGGRPDERTRQKAKERNISLP